MSRGKKMERHAIDNSGFTMVELLIVIAIVSIVAAIGTLASRDMYNNYKLKGAARQLFSDMQYARIGAIKGGKTWVVDFTDDNDYFVRPETPSATDRSKNMDIPSAYKGVKVCNFFNPFYPIEESKFRPDGTSSGRKYKVSLPTQSYKVHSLTGTGVVKVKKVDDGPCP